MSGANFNWIFKWSPERFHRMNFHGNVNGPGRHVIEEKQKVDDIVEAAKRDREALADLHAGDFDRAFSGGTGLGRLAAHVPEPIVNQSIREDWGPDDWKRWLNDPDNAKFRVWEGRV